MKGCAKSKETKSKITTNFNAQTNKKSSIFTNNWRGMNFRGWRGGWEKQQQIEFYSSHFRLRTICIDSESEWKTPPKPIRSGKQTIFPWDFMLFLITLRQTEGKLDRKAHFRNSCLAATWTQKWNLFIYSQENSPRPANLKMRCVQIDRLMDTHKRSSSLSISNFHFICLYINSNFFKYQINEKFIRRVEANTSYRRWARDVRSCVHRTAYVFILSIPCTWLSSFCTGSWLALFRELILEQGRTPSWKLGASLTSKNTNF